MSFEGPEPPPQQIPPPPQYTPAPAQEPEPKQPMHQRKGFLGAVVGVLLVIWKVILPVGKILIPLLKVGKLGKVLLTASTMLLSVWVYATRFGWQFALGFVLCIFVHEMGHVFVAWKQGVPVTAPIFIPGFGALIMQKRSAKTAWGESLIGIGGPAFGTLSGFACWGLYFATGNELFLGLAFTAFLLNLFNMLPIFPLDGGWIVGSIHPYLWIAGLVAFVAMALLGIMSNPFIWIIVIMSLPYVWMSFKRGSMGPPGVAPATKEQKWIMGVSYLALSGLLAWAMAASHLEPPKAPAPRNPAGIPVAFIPVSPNLS